MNKTTPILAIQLFSAPKSSHDLFEVISADAILVRADYLEEDESDIKNLSLTTGFKIFSLKSEQSGGKYKGSLENRHARLIEALDGYNVIELESNTDLSPDILSMIPPERRLISWVGSCDSFDELEAQFINLKGYEAKYYQCVNEPKNISECLWPLRLLKKYQDENLISFSLGATGVWSQLLSVFLGNPIIIGNLNKSECEHEFLLHEQITEDYDFSLEHKVDHIYGIAGNPVFSSMSPQIHNQCYKVLGMDALYLPFHIENFEDFWKFISKDFPVSGLDFKLGGFTMVSPYKEESFNVAEGHICSATLLSKACNILINKDGSWYSDSSDGLGVLTAIENEPIELQHAKIAIIGCGGAGRTIASRLKTEGANIVFYNRSFERGNFASKLLGLPFRAIGVFDASLYDIVINATPVGKNGKILIFDPSRLKSSSLAIDMAYTKEDTLLVSACRESDKKIIEGKQILLHQVKKQFSGLTNKEMPFEVEQLVRQKTRNLLKVD